MCGIAGIFGRRGDAVHFEEVQAMCNVIIHRGPNDEGYFIDDSIGLGMRRLSVIDLDTGQQPVSNESGTIQLVLNGEIYNYRELRRELLDKGHQFSSNSDTEVIAHLYEEHGPDCVNRLRGMFAFALWDSEQNRLMLARDRLGKKPLYYADINGRLVFASELKCLLQLPDVKRDLNWSSLGYLFSFLTTPPAESIIQGIHKLEPGHILTVEAGHAPVLTRYWDLDFNPDYSRSEASFVEELREIIDDSVRMRMISDVPLGAFLSGGLDSSAVVAMMMRNSTTPVKTFSIGFSEEQFNEAPFAREVAEALGTEHHELILQADALGILDDLVWHLDEPFGDPSAIPTYMVSRMAARHVTVALSGDGGDEVFAGYDKYCVEQRQRRYDRIPSPLRSVLGAIGGQMREGMKGRNFLCHIALSGHERYLNAQTMFGKSDRLELFQPAAAERMLNDDPWHELRICLAKEGQHWLSAIQYMDIKNYLPLDIMTKVDRMSMAHSLEARSPLLDHKLVEFAATIPPEMKLHHGRSKHILKQAMQGYLPDAIINRKKQGFAVPLGQWFRGEMNGFVRDIVLSPTSRARQIFCPDYIENLLRQHERGRPLDFVLWTLLSFELWCRTFLDQPIVKNVATREYRVQTEGKARLVRGRVASADTGQC